MFAGVRGWWESKPQQTRRFTKWVVPAGVVLLIVGLVVDAYDGWGGHEFGLNVVSSLTSLCFGAPAALLFFNSLGSAEVEARQRDRARVRAQAEVERFRDVLLRAFVSGDLGELGRSAALMRGQLARIRMLRNGDPERATAIQEFFVEWDKLGVQAASGSRPVDSFGRIANDRGQRDVMRVWRDLVKSQWKTLDTEVRPLLKSHDLPFLMPSHASGAEHAADRLMAAGRNPWNQAQANDGAGVAAMQYFMEDLSRLCRAADYLSRAYP
ncbi:hypothetical protein [Streptomyces chartreusis]